MKQFFALLTGISLVLTVDLASAALLPVPNSQPKVAYDWKPVLEKTWQGIKARNIAPYTTGMVHRPKSETPNDAVSEGQGYGMMVALFAGDQAAFDSIWTASNKYMWNGNALDWRTNVTGTKVGFNAATDAEQDVAAMLILADSLVKAGIWVDDSVARGNVGYAARAQVMLNHIWATMVESHTGTNGIEYHLRPGDAWGGYSHLNPGYYTPAYYRIFASFDTLSTHYWLELADQAYRTLDSTDGAALGLVPDWCLGNGDYTTGAAGYNGYAGGQYFFKDAIRILWRVATDALWFDEPKAKTFLAKSLSFLMSKGGAPAANFYTMAGDVVPSTDTWTFNGGNTVRHRNEHSPLTIGMWATVAMAVGTDAQRKAMSDEMQKFYGTGNDFFGLANDTSALQEDTLHNEMYFDQFLAWFGTAMMAGVYSNVMYDIANPPVVAVLPMQQTWQGLHIQRSPNQVHFKLGIPDVALRVLDLHGRELGRGLTDAQGNWIWNVPSHTQGVAIVRLVGTYQSSRIFSIE